MIINLKAYIAVAIIMGAASTIAHAQTNLTVYGVVDLGIHYVNNVNGHYKTRMVSGYGSGSRLGVKGVEKVSGDLSALFQIESGLLANNGHSAQGGRLYGRQSFVGLHSERFGTITLGRQYDAMGTYPGELTANNSWGGVLFCHPFDNDTSGSFRLENSIVYASPTLSGVTFGGAIGLGEEAGSFTDHLTYSLGARYKQGPLTLAMAYIHLDNPGLQDGRPVDKDRGSISNADANFRSELQRTVGLSASYAMTQATVNLIYFHTRINKPYALESFHNHAEVVDPYLRQLSSLGFDNVELNTSYHLNSKVDLGAMYVYTQGNAQNSSTHVVVKPLWHTLGGMASYKFSPHTDVYAQLVYQRRAGQQTGSDFDRAHILGAAGASSTNKQTVLRFALRHRF